jgi:murein DD-endopeptidase MepM/ murein hydrolase activator NlpD
LLNVVSGRLRFAQPRSTGTDRSETEAIHAAPRRPHRRAIALARFLADALTFTPRARERAVVAVRGRVRERQSLARGIPRRRLYRRRFMLRLTTDRAIPIAIALIVVLAAGVSLSPAAAPVGAAEGQLAAPQVRLVIGGKTGLVDAEDFGDAYVAAAIDAPVDDGTIYKPVAVDTSIKSSAAMLQHYTVKTGDTLTGIASRFGVSMMTVWWANRLTSKDSLKVGSDLVIPPVNGLIVTVKPGDTIDSLATANKIAVADIVDVNQLEDENLIVGQVLVLPGAKGAPIPTPKPTPRPQVAVGGGGGGGGSGGGGTVKYTGGRWAWPVIGGGNYISQYFHYGHYGVDIAADYGSTIVSPLAGRVVAAGWKSNGGGFQVWISHGNGIYTTLYHMSAVTVSSGQDVARGQRVGRVGMSGWASGPHVMIEVWIGLPWESGSYRVNPLRYY